MYMRATYNESELIEAVKDVEQRSLAAVDEIRRLKQRRFRYAERLCRRHKTLDVAQSHETRRSFRSIEDRWHSSGLQQTINQPTAVQSTQSSHMCHACSSLNPLAMISFTLRL